jgi:hypothetical protein
MLLFVFIQPFTIIPTPIRVAESSRTVVQLRLAPKIKCLSSIVQMHGLDRTRGNTAPAQDIALHTIVSNRVTPNQGHRTAFAVSFLHGFLGLMQGVRHDEWVDAREQSGKKTCGCANTLVDLCNSRAGGLWSLLGVSKMAGLVWKSHGMKTVTMKAPVDFPLAVSYHFVHHLANRRRARKHGSISSCASFPAAAATRPPSFTDPPAAVEVEWCSCRSMNRSLHKVTANTLALCHL